MLAGDVVNTAARLQTSAPVGGVLVGQATWELTRASIEYQPHDPVSVKGKAEPLPVWVAVGGRGSVGEALTDTSRPMIGREDELSGLQRAFTRAVREGSVQLVTVVAEPGLGKSRLVQAFFGWVDGREELVTWRQGRCPSYGDAVTFAALGEIVKAQTGILDGDPGPQATGKLVDTVHALVDGTDLASQESWLVARLAPLVGLPSTETPQEELFTAWRRFLETLASKSPLVLVVEDLHWADRAMLDFLTHLLDWMIGVPLVIVATARPELFDLDPHWGAGHRNGTTLTLAPLSDPETAQLVTSLLGTTVLPAARHAALLRRAEGNPLYTREYLNMLTDQHVDIGQSNAEPETDLTDSLPGSVQAVIAARLDTLPPEAKHLLQAAAVIGHTFWTGAAATLLDVEETAVAVRLHNLARRDYLRPSRASSIAGQTEYTFSHALIADVAYQQLPRNTRATHHHHAADWHATLTSPDTAAGDGTGGVAGQAPLIAHHYTQAHRLTQLAGGDPVDIEQLAGLAAHWHTHAATFAQQVDLAAAETHTRTALTLTPVGHHEHPHTLLLLGQIYLSAGRASDAEAAFQEAHDQSQTDGDPVAAALADVYRSIVLESLARAIDGNSLVDHAVTVLEKHPAGVELLDAYTASASSLMRQGRIRQAVDRAEQSLTLAGRLDHPPPRLVADALRIRGSSKCWSGDLAGEHDLTQALDLAHTHNLTTMLIRINNEIGLMKVLTESAHAAIPHYEQAVALAADRGHKGDFLFVSANLAEALVVASRVDDALAMCDRGAAHLADTDTDSPQAAVAVRSYWAWILTIRGGLKQARAVIEQALPDARGADLSMLAACLLVAIECAYADHDHDTVTTLTQELVMALDDPGFDTDAAQYLPRLARILAPAGQHDLVNRIIRHTPTGMLLADNNVLTARAILAETAGNHPEALRLHTQAAAQWKSYGHPLEQAHALLGAARCHHTDGRPAQDLILQARDILTALGAHPLLTETEKLLAAATK